MNIIPSLYQTVRRGITARKSTPIVKAQGGPRSSAMTDGRGITVIGDQIISQNFSRTYFSFQNNSVAGNPMFISVSGAPATAQDKAVLAGQTAVFDVTVPAGDIHVFCATAGDAYAFTEGN